MEWKDLAGVVGKAAPILGTLIAGPAGAAVGSLVASALGVSTADEASEVLKGNPDAYVKLRELEQSKEVRFAELAAAQAKLEIESAVADRASAREREAKTGDSWTPRLLAFLVTAGFFGVLGFLLVAGKPNQGGDVLLVMLGSLGTAWTSIVSYYFGSSAGSAQKTELLNKKGVA